MSFPAACLIALLLGAVCVLGFAPYGLWFVPIVALAGCFLLLLRFTTRRSRLGLAACFGFAYFFIGVGWLYISLNHYGGVPALFAVLAVGLFAAYLALFPLMAVYFASHMQVSHVYWLLLVLPACYGLGEWLRGWLFSGFPWLAVGYAQIPGGWLAGYAPVLGIYGVSYLSLLSAGGLACLFAPGIAPRQRIAAVVLLTAVWGIGGALQQISWTEAVGKPISVALLQGNVPQDRKWQEEALQETFAQVAELASMLAEHGLELDHVVELTVDLEEVVDRLVKRAGAGGRTDDSEEVIRHRQELFARETAPLVAAYAEQGLLTKVDGMGTVDEVSSRIFAALGI